MRRLGLLAIATLLAGCMTVDPLALDDSDFTPLFDGRSLEGFVTVLDSPWVVSDGIASSRQNPAGRLEGESWLLTKKPYRDFVLRVSFRITPGGNSGVFVRVPVPWNERLASALGGPVPWDAGYEANINNDEPNYPTGSIWALAPAPKLLQREGEWNEMLIHLVGQRISTWVNRVPAVQNFELPAREGADTGAIGFQRHGGEAYREKLIEIGEVMIYEL